MVAVYLLWPLQQQLDLERIPNLFFNHERAPSYSSAIKMDFLKKELGPLYLQLREQSLYIRPLKVNYSILIPARLNFYESRYVAR